MERPEFIIDYRDKGVWSHWTISIEALKRGRGGYQICGQCREPNAPPFFVSDKIVSMTDAKTGATLTLPEMLVRSRVQIGDIPAISTRDHALAPKRRRKWPKFKRSEVVLLEALAIGAIIAVLTSFVLTPLGGIIIGIIVAAGVYPGLLKYKAETTIIDRL